MNVEIFVVSCARHFSWLEYCLRSISMFVSGFSGVTALIPRGQEKECCAMMDLLPSLKVPIVLKLGDEWPDKGFLWHEAQIIRADEWCPDADYILHTDSDCLFTEPVTPEDYFVDGNPVLMHASFKWLINTQQANLVNWKIAAEAALGWKVDQELMRRHPAVHPRKLYAKTRECIEKHTGKSCDDYIRSCENGFPQTAAEFPTLGAVAWKFFHNDYHWIDQQTQGHPPNKLVQFWGNSPPDVPQSPVYKGSPFTCTPAELLKICEQP